MIRQGFIGDTQETISTTLPLHSTVIASVIDVINSVVQHEAVVNELAH